MPLVRVPAPRTIRLLLSLPLAPTLMPVATVSVASSTITVLLEEVLVLPIFIEAAELLPPLVKVRETPLLVEKPTLKRRLPVGPPERFIEPVTIAAPLLTVMMPA